MKQIDLRNGTYAVVDDEDYDRLSQFRWNYRNGYAIRELKNQQGKRIRTAMHHDIIGRIDGLEVDHINGNRADNRRENLRFATHSQNMANKIMRQGTSKYKGVCWNKKDKVWIASVEKDGKYYHAGSYHNEEEAAIAYNKKAWEIFGEFARVNLLPEVT